jgi:hypothetical protein
LIITSFYSSDEPGMAFSDFNNVLYKSLNEEQKEFVKKNMKSKTDVLPLTVFLFQLKKAGRDMPESKQLSLKQLIEIRTCFYTTLPEPGTMFGLLLSQAYLQPRQQQNLNVKRFSAINEANVDHSGNQMEFYSLEEYIPRIKKYMSFNKNEVLLSLNDKNEIIYMSYFCKTRYDYTNFKNKFIDCVLKYLMSIQIKEWKEEGDENKIYFVVFCNKKVYKEFLIAMSNIETIDLQFWLIFTSDRLSARDLTHFITNSSVFLYCFLTERYKPDLEDLFDEITCYLCLLIAYITYALGCNSLKRSGMAKGGFGPLTFLVSEGGLDYIGKYLNKQQECKDFKINTVFEKLFLNLPIKCGSLYEETKLLPKM